MSLAPEDNERFYEILLGIMEIVEEKASDGEYLQVCNWAKELKEVLDKAKQERVFVYLERSVQRLRGRRMTEQYNVDRNDGTAKVKEVCPKCGRAVLDVKQHQERRICRQIQREKLASKSLGNVEITDAHYRALQSFASMVKPRRQWLKRRSDNDDDDDDDNEDQPIVSAGASH